MREGFQIQLKWLIIERGGREREGEREIGKQFRYL
jgi:hypothetical protein